MFANFNLHVVVVVVAGSPEEEDDMMIPSEQQLSSLLPANQNGHHGGHFGEAMFQQHAEQLVRSQLLGQLGQDQMQLLHSLQQLGRKQKEVCKQLPAVLLSHQFTKIVKCWMPIFVLFLK